MVVNIHEAKTRLAQLVERARNGEEVIIAKAGEPMVRLTPVTAGPPRQLGAARGLVSETPGWDRPMADEEADEFAGV